MPESKLLSMVGVTAMDGSTNEEMQRSAIPYQFFKPIYTIYNLFHKDNVLKYIYVDFGLQFVETETNIIVQHPYSLGFIGLDM